MSATAIQISGTGRVPSIRKADAQKFANLVEADITRGEWLDPLLGKETFGDWAEPLGSDDRWPHSQDP
jgi:hypothetical protein